MQLYVLRSSDTSFATCLIFVEWGPWRCFMIITHHVTNFMLANWMKRLSIPFKWIFSLKGLFFQVIEITSFGFEKYWKVARKIFGERGSGRGRERGKAYYKERGWDRERKKVRENVVWINRKSFAWKEFWVCINVSRGINAIVKRNYHSKL